MRVRIVGTRVDANEIVRAGHSPTQFAIGTMKVVDAMLIAT